MAAKQNTRLERRRTYTLVTGVFLSLFAGFSALKSWRRFKYNLTPFDLVQLGLATYRLGRLVSYDKVTEPYRAPFTRTVVDPSGAGETVVPRNGGVRGALGDLIACPICAGTWIAAGLVYGLHLAPGITRSFVAIMSTIGAAEFLNAATEAFEWTGQAEREKAGFERTVHATMQDGTREQLSRLPAQRYNPMRRSYESPSQ